MPRPALGARLYLRRRPGRPSVWVIRDGGTEIATGTDSRAAADLALADYLTRRARPRGPAAAEDMTVGQVLTIYAEDHAPRTAAPERIGYAILALEPFWGALKVRDITGATCRRYEAQRGVAPGTVRRELGTLQAALNWCATEGHLLTAPRVWRPAPPPPKDRWLTRAEAARLLRAARRLRVDGRHLVRFILAGLYTGTRKEALLRLRIDQPSTDGGWIDTERGVLYRAGEGARQTKKRQTPARVPRPFLGHVRRWQAQGARFVVQDYQGRRLASVKKAWATAAAEAGLPGITPHVLRHTCATWIMQGGADIWHAASYLGMTVETLQRTYGHHHPDHQDSAVRALESRAQDRGA